MKFKFNYKIISLVILMVFLVIIEMIFYNKMAIKIAENNVIIDKAKMFVKENQEPIFSVDKITLFTNLDVNDKSEKKDLKNIDLTQYTDIAIYINNKNKIKENNEENAISKLSIENIKVETISSNGEKIVDYKDPYSFGKYRNLDKQKNKIIFNVLGNNKENTQEIYEEPTFYEDCSNPISLGYLNKNFLTKYNIKENEDAVAFNGSILKRANIGLDVLNSKIVLTIKIENKLKEKFICNLEIDNNLEDENGGLYTGYIGKTYDFPKNKNVFIKIID